MSELCDHSAVELRRWIGAKEISPVELLDACLARIESVNPAVNAFVALDTDRARRAAAEAERAVLRGETLGALHGLPIGIKDLSETAGLRTTYGSMLFEHHIPATDDAVVARLRAAGAIIVGKTNTPEFGAGANTRNAVYGATGNPFATDLTASGSSGGSAAALACGMVPLANGTDLGGSLRTPAGFCGVVGMRPTPGLVPGDRRGAGWSPLSVEGPLGRSVGDLALLLSAMASGDTGDDPLAAPVDPISFASPSEIDLSTLSVAISEDLGFAPVSAEIRRVFRQRCGGFADLFRQSVERDPDLGDADRTFAVLRGEAFLARRVLFDSAGDRLGYPVRANLDQALGYSYQDYALAHVEQTRLYRRFQAMFREIDVLICPVALVTPFPHEIWAPEEIDGEKLAHYFHWIGLTYGLTLTGHPVVALPCGVDEHGMPFGIQIVGPRREDRFVLGVATALERAFAARPWLARPVPDLAALSSRR